MAIQPSRSTLEWSTIQVLTRSNVNCCSNLVHAIYYTEQYAIWDAPDTDLYAIWDAPDTDFAGFRKILKT